MLGLFREMNCYSCRKRMKTIVKIVYFGDQKNSGQKFVEVSKVVLKMKMI
jgi:hypothetical protein